MKVNRRSFLASLGGLIATVSTPGLSLTAETDGQLGTQRNPGRFGDLDDNTLFDVCIIGSGFAGTVLGEALVQHGIKTVIVESGPDPRGKSIDPRFQQLDVYRSSGPMVYPVVSTRFRGVGGTSWLWRGMCPRLHPMDFEKNAYSPPEASWPINYRDLRPYYKKAEKALRVRGGKRSRYHPHRNGNYTIQSDRDISPFNWMLLKAGIVVSDVPYSTSKDHRSSFLNHGIGPFVRMTDSHLPAFQKSPFGSLIPEVTVTRLTVDDGGNIAGAEIRDLDRNTKILRARVYVVACGGLESPRLLLLSSSAAFPNGIGNNRDLVGRFFMEHLPVIFEGYVQLGWQTFSFFPLHVQSYQFYKEFKNLGLGGMTLGFWLAGAIDREAIKSGEFGEALDGISNRELNIILNTEMKPSPQNRVTLDAKAKDYFGNPGINLFVSESDDDVRTVARGKQIVREIFADLGVENFEELPRTVWGHHHMGTCRMGDNPRTSVVDSNLQVHGTKNLFVAGSSVFVTSGTANPTLTLTALARRLSDYLRSELQNGAFPIPNYSQNKGRPGAES
jgi:glucose dehydrogenase